jgi:hypothetical protein
VESLLGFAFIAFILWLIDSDRTDTRQTNKEKRGQSAEPKEIESALIGQQRLRAEAESLLISQQRINAIEAKFGIKAQAKRTLGNHGIFSFWHLTEKLNVSSIVNQGILNHKDARKGQMQRDISDPEVQLNRDRNDPFYGRSLYDYAPLYFNPRNPMMFRRKELDLCLIEVSIDLLNLIDENRCIFTDGNAASAASKFYCSYKDLNQIPWDALEPEYWTDILDGKRKRCAEVLIFPNVDPIYIIGVHCSNRDTQIFLNNQGHVARYSPHMFFRS